jgi:hypothetical protein
MWRRLKNFLLSFRSYPDLGPDLALRRKVNRALADRRALPPDAWFEAFWQTRNISQEITFFVYTQLTDYSGISFSRVIPGDRLDHDLHLTLICWFNWQLDLCEDFFQQFHVDISDRLDFHTITTVEDLVVFLNLQLLSVNRS